MPDSTCETQKLKRHGVLHSVRTLEQTQPLKIYIKFTHSTASIYYNGSWGLLHHFTSHGRTAGLSNTEEYDNEVKRKQKLEKERMI